MLTKSDYIKYLQCPKYLWLHKNRKDLLSEEVDLDLEKIFEGGFAVEKFAYKLFSGGVNVQSDNFFDAIKATEKLMKNKTEIIFQPSVLADDLFCRADIIRYNKNKNTWDIIEVKSSTQVKNVHIDDLSFQKICFEKAGYKIDKMILLYVNNQYVKNGEIKVEEFLIQEDISMQVKKKEKETKQEIKKAFKLLEMSDEPELRVLRQCNNPYECSFIHYCWKDFPEHSIYSIAGKLGEKKLNALLDEGVMEAKDIPKKYLTNEKLKKHCFALKSDQVYIDKVGIKKELNKIKYPVYFLDYETYGPVIPIIDGYRPYQRIIFQYSLHIQEKPDGKLKHYYFLAKDLKDPTKELSKTLTEWIGKSGSVIAWNMGFEQGCNEEMGERDLEFREFYENINDRMYDLMDIFKKDYYVHKDFYASASLKKVLPVLVPELSYQDLEIQEGMMASNSWGDMVSKKLNEEEKNKIYSNLLNYCELDTLAMVRILEELNKVIK